MDNQNIKTNEEISNATFALTKQGESPLCQIILKYKDDIIYKFDHGRLDFPIGNDLKSLPLTEIEKYHDTFIVDFKQFCNDTEDQNQELRGMVFVASGYVLKCIMEIINEKKNPKNRPDYITELINNRLLNEDGYRVITKLEDVACFLIRENKVPLTEKFLSDNFRKPNGERYSSSACKEAANFANSN